MCRTLLALLWVSLFALADNAGDAPPPKLDLKFKVRTGQRFTGSSSVSYTITTSVRQGEQKKESSESVQRTERFVDKVLRASRSGTLEVERSFLRLFTKARASDEERPNVYQSPLQGRTIVMKDSVRRRELTLKGRGAIDSLVRRTAGMDFDWRDIFPEDPVGPGDSWEAESTNLGRRLAAYLECGNRSTMRVRFEQVIEEEGVRLVQLYVDWTVQGMRDRHLFTKVTLSGDIYFDLALKRIVTVDLLGKMIVRGAILGEGAPKIVKGEGPVELKSSIKLAPNEVEAAAGPEDDE